MSMMDANGRCQNCGHNGWTELGPHEGDAPGPNPDGSQFVQCNACGAVALVEPWAPEPYPAPCGSCGHEQCECDTEDEPSRCVECGTVECVHQGEGE